MGPNPDVNGQRHTLYRRHVERHVLGTEPRFITAYSKTVSILYVTLRTVSLNVTL